MRRAIEFQRPDRLPVRFDAPGLSDVHNVGWNQIGTGDKRLRETLDFWVGVSGSGPRTGQAGDLVHMRCDRVLELLDAGDLDDAALKAWLDAAKVDPA